MTVSFNGSLFSLYDGDCGWCRDIRFTEANIPPGGSLQFTFATLTPKSSIAPGTYRNFPDQPLMESLSLHTRRIPDLPLIIQVIPEPSTLALACCGMLLLLAKPVLRRIARSR